MSGSRMDLVRTVEDLRMKAGLPRLFRHDLEQLSVTRLTVMIEEARRAAEKKGTFERGLFSEREGYR